MPTCSTRKRAAPAPGKKNQEASLSGKSTSPSKNENTQVSVTLKKARRICCIDGCTNLGPRKGGLCTKHYNDAANDQPAAMMPAKKKTKKNDKDKPASQKQKQAAKQITATKTKNDKPTTTSPQTQKQQPARKKKTRNASQMTTPTWEEMFYKLVLFQANNQGSTIIPDEDTSNQDLAKWAATQRILYRNATIHNHHQQQQQGATTTTVSSLTQQELQRQKALQQIGFLFEARTSKKASARNTANWNERYQQLLEYGRTHNGSYNPPNTKQCPIGTWVHMQRMAYREYNHLLQVFQTKYPNHPIVNPEDIASRRDDQYMLKDIGMAGYISKERIDKLNALEGFIWTFRPSNMSFEERVEQYKEFQRTEGHGLVPQYYKKVAGLGKWVAKMRCEYKAYREGKKSRLTPERIELLRSIKFEFCYGDSRGIKSSRQFRESKEKLGGYGDGGGEEEEEEEEDDEEAEVESEGV